jgi:endonuclease YncB( thermonuclease family)
MRWMVAVGMLLAGSLAHAADCRVTVVGKVVAVVDGHRLWVYVPEVRASYRFALSGFDVPSLDQRCGSAARDALARLVLGREVRVEIEPVLDDEVPAEVFLSGQSINSEMARFVATLNAAPAANPAGETQPRRPLLTLCTWLRLLPPTWRDRNVAQR